MGVAARDLVAAVIEESAAEKRYLRFGAAVGQLPRRRLFFSKCSTPGPGDPWVDQARNHPCGDGDDCHDDQPNAHGLHQNSLPAVNVVRSYAQTVTNRLFHARGFSLTPVPLRGTAIKPRQGPRLRIALAQQVAGVGLQVFMALSLARWPANFNCIDAVACAQTEVQPGIVGRFITSAA